ncbi:hypothetical protein ABPG75_003918 [Micractinium tetrahymenae]
MPPKRAIKKAKVKTQTFYEPYMFRPIAISLPPTDIQLDIEVMNALLVAQRAALKRASLERASGTVPLAAPPPQHTAYAHGGAASDAATTSDDEAAQAQQQAMALQQQQWQYQQAAALAAQHPLPGKLSSPTCTFQHQQAFAQQQMAGYALA